MISLNQRKTSSLAFGGYVPHTVEAAFVAASTVLVGQIHLGKDSSIWFGSVLRGDINTIRIGARSNIQDGCMLHVTSELPVNVGSNVTVGHGAILHGCKIGKDCMIGMGSIVLDGAQIGDECIIGAGSLIPPRRVILPRSVVMGSPGRVVRTVSSDELKAARENCNSYVELARSYFLATLEDQR